jgi:hypothetical protein
VRRERTQFSGAEDSAHTRSWDTVLPAGFRWFVTRLAIECNWHVHNDTCFKYLAPGEPRTDVTCWMCITGQTRAVTEIDEETQSILLWWLHPWINNFNDVVLFQLQSNMDIKFIGSGPTAKALVYYVSDYITKTDLKVHVGIQSLQVAMHSHGEKFDGDDVSSRDFRDRNLLTKCVNSLMGRQELSHQQVMSYLVVGGNFYTGHKFRSVRLYQFTAALTNHECQPHVDSDDATTSADLCTHDREEENVTLNTSPSEVKLTSDFLDYRFRLVDTAFELMNVWEFMEDSTKVSKRTSSGGSLGKVMPRKWMRMVISLVNMHGDGPTASTFPATNTQNLIPMALDFILLVLFLSYLGTTFLGRTSIKKHSVG